MKEPAVLLFAHGAREARWAEPFERVAELMRRTAPERPVELAYLEFLRPDMAEGVERLAARGATRIRVVPLFFGRGGHLRDSVPRLVAATRAAIPAVTIDVVEPAGEDEAVIQAVAAYCLRAADKL